MASKKKTQKKRAAKKPLSPAELPLPTSGKIAVELSPDELSLLYEALDSHIYWQLSDEGYRSSGYVLEPGSDDDENAEEIKEAEALKSRIFKLQKGTP